MRTLEADDDARRYARMTPICLGLNAVLLVWACVDIIKCPAVETCLELLLPLGSFLGVKGVLSAGHIRADDRPTHPSTFLTLGGAVMLAGNFLLPNLYHFQRAAFSVVGSLMLAVLALLLVLSAYGYMRLQRATNSPALDK